MTARYALYTIDQLRDRFTASSGVPKGVKPHYNIAPAQSVPVVIRHNTDNQIRLMKWGFIPKGAKDTNSIFRYKTYGARSEEIFEKPTWQFAIREQRCIIPANGFYEWKTVHGDKRPFYIHPNDQPLFGFAGIYGDWTDPAGNTYGMCALITTASDADSDLIPSRLPVIVTPEDEADWLNPAIGDINTLYRIMRPYDPEHLTIIPVSNAVNSSKKDTPDLIERIIGRS